MVRGRMPSARPSSAAVLPSRCSRIAAALSSGGWTLPRAMARVAPRSAGVSALRVRVWASLELAGPACPGGLRRRLELVLEVGQRQDPDDATRPRHDWRAELVAISRGDRLVRVG